MSSLATATKYGPDFMKDMKKRLLKISTPTSPAGKLYGDRERDFTTPENSPVADIEQPKKPQVEKIDRAKPRPRVPSFEEKNNEAGIYQPRNEAGDDQPTTAATGDLAEQVRRLQIQNKMLQEDHEFMANEVRDLASQVTRQAEAMMAGWAQCVQEEMKEQQQRMQAEWGEKMREVEETHKRQIEDIKLEMKAKNDPQVPAAGWNFDIICEPLDPLDTLTYAYRLPPDIAKERKEVHDIPTLATYLRDRIHNIQKTFDEEDDYESKMEKTLATISAALPSAPKEVHVLTAMQIARECEQGDAKNDIDIAVFNALCM